MALGTVTRRDVLKSFATVAVGAATGAGTYGYLYERHHLEITRADVPLPGLSPDLIGFRIGLLTDIHRSEFVTDADVAQAVDMVMGEKPDLIVLGGDYVTRADRAFMPQAAEGLKPLSAPHGVFAILGNHDDDHDMPAALEKNGIEVLKDERTRLPVNGAALELVGIRFWTKRASDIEAVTRGANGTIVLLAHDPRRLAEAQGLKIPLVLAGHTHGGQVVLPVVGPPPFKSFPWWAGLGRQGDTTMFISRGVGTVYVPVRVNCPPEVAILRLERASNAA
jgi:predicted MPP superfamily phosphohydrolase